MEILFILTVVVIFLVFFIDYRKTKKKKALQDLIDGLKNQIYLLNHKLSKMDDYDKIKFDLEKAKDTVTKTKEKNSDLTVLNSDLRTRNTNLNDKNKTLLSEISDYKRDYKDLSKDFSDYKKESANQADYIRIQNEINVLNNINAKLVEENSTYNQIKFIHENYIVLHNGLIKLKDEIKVEEDKLSAVKEKGKKVFEKIKLAIDEEKQKVVNINSSFMKTSQDLVALNLEVDRLNNIIDEKDFELYFPSYSSADATFFITSINECLLEQKTAIVDDLCVLNKSLPYTDESPSTYKRRVITISKNMINLFNKECELIINKINVRNGTKMIDKANKIFHNINKVNTLNVNHSYALSDYYLILKTTEIKLKFEYELAKQQERDNQEAIKAQMREDLAEERKIAKEIEKAQLAAIQAEKEEIKFAEELHIAREELRLNMEEQFRLQKLEELDRLNANNLLHEDEKNKLHDDILERERIAKLKEDEMNLTILQLENDLKAAQEAKERNKSMAQQTRSGHVYIISNIGSFGEGVVKIGMTRRLQPMDRVKELGDASVPFGFDVHAIIQSNDAPALENELHKRFADNRLNLVNHRKEFFNINVQDIANYLNEQGFDLRDLNIIPNASEYLESKAIRAIAERDGVPVSSIIRESDSSFLTEYVEDDELEEIA